MVTTNDLISLPRFTAYTRMMINGVTSDPFSIKTMPLQKSEGSVEQTRKIIEQSRQRYAMPKSELESLLDAWQKKTFSPAEKIAFRGKLQGQGIDNTIIDKFFASGEDDRTLWYDTYQKKNPLSVTLNVPSDIKETTEVKKQPTITSET